MKMVPLQGTGHERGHLLDWPCSCVWPTVEQHDPKTWRPKAAPSAGTAPWSTHKTRLVLVVRG